jgi:hypothetical protein
MARPQQPELARNAKTDLDPDHIETGLQGVKTPKSGGETGPVPPDNQPGHHPPKEQDKPDLDAFAARLGTDPSAPTATSARKGARPRGTAAKAGPAKAGPAKAAPAKGTTGKATPAQTSSRPATTASQGPAAPPKIETTPANRPAAAPGWPESAPAASGGYDDGGRLPAKAEDGHGDQSESRLIGLMLMPLRETVKRLEQLDETLTERLSSARRSARRKVGLKDR